MNKVKMKVIKTVGLILAFELLMLLANAQEQKPELVVQTGHPKGVRKIVFSPNDKLITTADAEAQSVKLWDASNKTQIRSFSTGDSKIWDIKFSADSKNLVSVGGENIEFWDVETGNKIKEVRIPRLFQCLSNLNDDATYLVGNCGFDVIIWETATGKTLHNFKLNLFDSFSSIALSPNNDLVVRGDTLINIKTGEIFKLNIPENKTNTVKSQTSGGSGGRTYIISDAVFSPDSKILAISESKRIILYETLSGKILHLFEGVEEGSISMAFSPNGKFLISGREDKTIKIWDVESKKELSKITNKQSSVIECLAFSKDGRQLASGGAESIVRLWDFESGTEIGTIGVFSAESKSISINPKILKLASLENDGKIKIWNLESGEEPLLVDGFASSDSIFTFTSDGSSLMSLFYPYVYFWSAENGTLINKSVFPYAKKNNFGREETFAISPNGKMFANGSFAGDLVSGIKPNNEQELKAFRTSGINYGPLELLNEYIKENPDNQKIESQTKGFLQEYARVISVEFSQDSKYIITKVENFNGPVGNLPEIDPYPTIGDSTVTVRKTEDNTILGKVNGQILNFALSPNANLLAITENTRNNTYGTSPTKTSVWNVTTQTLLKSFDEDPKFDLRQNGELVFSPNGKILAGVFESTIRLWDIEKGTEIANLSGHSGKVTSISFSSNGKFLISSGVDTSIKFWDVEIGKELCSLHSFNKNDWLVTTPDGLFDGSQNAWRQLMWRFDKNTFSYAPVEAFFKEFYYPGLLQEIMQGKTPTPPAKDLSQIDIRQPVVKITEIDGKPTNSAEKLSADKQTVKVRVEIEDNSKSERKPNFPASSGANDLRLFRNGSLVRLWKKKGVAGSETSSVFELTKEDGCTQIAATKDAPRKAVCEVDVQIASGENNFTAYAFNHENVKSTDAPQVSVEGKFPKRDGTLYVLAIGVNKYKNTDYNLNYAVKDVQEIGTVLQEQQAKLGNLKQYGRTEIIALTDQTATKENILKALTLFSGGGKDAQFANLSETVKTQLSKIKPAQPEDAVIIYFAGHGVSKGQRFYLLPHNFTGDAGLLEKESVSDLELNDYLEKVDAGRLLMVIDACQSGAALGGKNDGRAPMNSKGFAQLAYDKGMFILTAAQSQQAALEAVRIGDKTIENGLLTYTLLQAFSNKESDKDANSQLWETEWFDYAVSQVPLFQREAMRQREVELKTGNPQVKGRSGIFYVNGEDKKNADERGVQTPRVFYRREADVNPFILANQ